MFDVITSENREKWNIYKPKYNKYVLMSLNNTWNKKNLLRLKKSDNLCITSNVTTTSHLSTMFGYNEFNWLI